MSDIQVSPSTKSHSKPKNSKRKLFDWHSWLGFNLAFLTMLLLATGTIATVSNEIDWLIQDDMRVTPDGSKVSWGEMEASVRAAAAPEDMLSIFSEGEGDHFAYRATFTRPDGTRYFIHVNQWTGEVTGTTPFLTVQRFFRDLHRYFFMPSFIGLPITSSLAIVLMISLYTGLKTTGRIKKAAFRIRRGKDIRVFLSDLHKVSGIWSIWFIVLMTVTAIWYLVEFGGLVVGNKFEPSRPGPTAERIQEFGGAVNMISADQIIENAKGAFPNWRPVQILFPVSHKQSITVLGFTNDVFVRSRANRVFLDPEDGSIIKVQKSKEIGWVAYINEIADPLHFGNIGSLTTKLIWFFFGVLLTGMSVTGVLMTYKRLKKTHISSAQIKTFPILIATVIVGYFYVDRQVSRMEPSQIINQEVHSTDGYKFDAQLLQGKSEKHYLQVKVQHRDGIPLIKALEVIDKENNAYKVKQNTFSSTSVFTRTIPKPMIANSMTLKVEFVSGIKKEFIFNR
ncbi:PepSY domain-containing protein [Alteromonadaceae bacterium M269]|nr:PepSY domain-containing protein [Alteromonadaceae bacterium M269]